MPQILFSNFNQSQGLNIGVNQYLNKDGECREALNCDFSEVGTLQRHLGYTTYGDKISTSAILGLYDFKTIATGVTKWIAKNATKLYYDNAGTWTDTGATVTTAEDITFCTHLDTLIGGSISDAPVKSTNGTSFSTLSGSPPKAKYWLTFDNKVYALNLKTYPYRIRWSDDGTIETWTSTNIQDVATNIGIGDQITGGTVNNNNLLVFKNYSTWKWDTYELRTLHSSIGCRAPKSIATIDDWSFWLSHQGIYATNGGKPFRISKPVKAFIEGITDITTPVGWAEDNFYYLYIGTSNGITNCLLIYDYDNNVWSYKSMADVIKQAAVLTTSGNVRSAYIGDDAGQVYKFKTGNNDNGDPIPFKWVGAPQMSGNAHLQKDYKYFYVFLDRTAKYGIDVSYSVDFEDFKPLGTAYNAISELPFPAGTPGHNIRIMYSTNLTTDQQKILGHLAVGDVLRGRLGEVV
jgi:hypothetical protein